jgi:hypothetical protein
MQKQSEMETEHQESLIDIEFTNDFKSDSVSGSDSNGKIEIKSDSDMRGKAFTSEVGEHMYLCI